MTKTFCVASKTGHPAFMRYVSGFSQQHQIVQVTPEATRAKKFTTRVAASKWLIARSDCGYGISSTDYHVVEL